MRECLIAVRAVVAVLALATSAASAGAQSFSGTTAGAAVFNRLISPCGSSSGVGTAVRYHVQQLNTSVTGSYVFTSTATGAWDNYLFLYQSAFTAATPSANCVTGNDDNPTIGLSGFTSALTAGTEYFLVTTGFGNADQGAFTNSISGPASVTFGPGTVVPEPSTYALMGTGLAGLIGVARRKRITA